MSDSTEILVWLQQWYRSQTNGVWEHQYGVLIDTLDNPGWRLKIDLTETTLAAKTFSTIDENRGADDWMMCRVLDGKFEAAGDPAKLIKTLEIFKDWVST